MHLNTVISASLGSPSKLGSGLGSVSHPMSWWHVPPRTLVPPCSMVAPDADIQKHDTAIPCYTKVLPLPWPDPLVPRQGNDHSWLVLWPQEQIQSCSMSIPDSLIRGHGEVDITSHSRSLSDTFVPGIGSPRLCTHADFSLPRVRPGRQSLYWGQGLPMQPYGGLGSVILFCSCMEEDFHYYTLHNEQLRVDFSSPLEPSQAGGYFRTLHVMEWTC